MVFEQLRVTSKQRLWADVAKTKRPRSYQKIDIPIITKEFSNIMISLSIFVSTAQSFWSLTFRSSKLEVSITSHPVVTRRTVTRKRRCLPSSCNRHQLDTYWLARQWQFHSQLQSCPGIVGSRRWPAISCESRLILAMKYSRANEVHSIRIDTMKKSFALFGVDWAYCRWRLEHLQDIISVTLEMWSFLVRVRAIASSITSTQCKGHCSNGCR